MCCARRIDSSRPQRSDQMDRALATLRIVRLRTRTKCLA